MGAQKLQATKMERRTALGCRQLFSSSSSFFLKHRHAADLNTTFLDNEVLIRQGEDFPGLFILSIGKLRVEDCETGEISYQTERGDILGLSCILERKKSNLNVRCTKNGTKIIMV